MIVVADTSPLNYLILIQRIQILPQLFGQVLAPPAVARELAHERAPLPVRAWIAAPPSWFTIRSPKTRAAFPDLGLGEAEALALAFESGPSTLLVDERAARQMAARQGIPTVGTVGVLELAAARALTYLPDDIAAIRATNFQIEETILAEALQRDAQRRQEGLRKQAGEQ